MWNESNYTRARSLCWFFGHNRDTNHFGSLGTITSDTKKMQKRAEHAQTSWCWLGTDALVFRGGLERLPSRCSPCLHCLRPSNYLIDAPDIEAKGGSTTLDPSSATHCVVGVEWSSARYAEILRLRMLSRKNGRQKRLIMMVVTVALGGERSWGVAASCGWGGAGEGLPCWLASVGFQSCPWGPFSMVGFSGACIASLRPGQWDPSRAWPRNGQPGGGFQSKLPSRER